MQLQQNTVTMTITDQPLPPISEKDGLAENQSPKPQRTGPAALRAVWKAIGAGLAEIPSESSPP